MKLVLVFLVGLSSLVEAQEARRELVRFTRAAQSHDDVRAALTRRDARRRRRIRQRRFPGELDRQLRIEREERARAITRFEAFLRQHGDDSHAPDAMFRLGELYFERSDDAVDPDFGPTIELYRDLLARFPQYARRDAVLYLLGYALREMDLHADAKRSWLRLVCADASAITERERYARCRPRLPSDRFVVETWLRLGEWHFDDLETDSLDWAISAYAHVLRHPQNRNYPLALYKTAWSHYRASRYPDAIRFFGEMVQWSDDNPSRHASLRSEAVQYIAICFAYDDWNENQVPDAAEGMPDSQARVADARLLPQDRSWTPEVFVELGQVFFDEAKYPEAVGVWRQVLSRWPNHPLAPELLQRIARAHERFAQLDRARATRRELAAFELQPWAEAQSDVQSVRRAEQLVAQALMATAIADHRQAQEERRQAVELAAAGDRGSARSLAAARDHYALAARSYRRYLSRYPNSPDAYELRYNLADALYWAESWEEAALEYARVRDSMLGDRFLSEAGRRAVESLHQLILAQPGILRDAPPSMVAGRVEPVEMPNLVRRWARARDLYLRRVSAADDREEVRGAYAYNNALLLYLYGHWELAGRRLQRIFRNRCDVDATSEAAWDLLYVMASARRDDTETRRLAEELNQRACTYGDVPCPRGHDLQALCRSTPDAVCCAASPHNLVFRRALDLHRQAERATEPNAGLYEQAATLFIQAVDENPTHPDAPIALEYAAVGLERTGRLQSSQALYRRIVDMVGPLRARDDLERERFDRIVANALFRLAYQANRLFDDEAAIRWYRELVDSARFGSSSDERIREFRADALVNLAVIHERRAQWDDAARFYARLTSSSDEDTARLASFRVGEVAWLGGERSEAVRAFRSFLSRYERDRSAGDLRVKAWWRIAQSTEGTRAHPAAMRDVIAEHARSGLGPDDPVTDHVAEARFRLAESPFSPSIRLSAVSDLDVEIARASAEAGRAADGYDSVFGLRRPRWTLRAWVEQGRIYEALASAIVNASMPRRLRDSMATELRGRAAPVMCIARERYLRAAQIAQNAQLDDPAAQRAFDRLAATDACPDEPATPTRVVRGLLIEQAVGGPPPLAR